MGDVVRVYTYCLLDEAGSVCGLEFEGCRDDRAARGLAREILGRHPGRAAVEVRRGEVLVERLGRGQADASGRRWSATADRAWAVGGADDRRSSW